MCDFNATMTVISIQIKTEMRKVLKDLGNNNKVINFLFKGL